MSYRVEIRPNPGRFLRKLRDKSLAGRFVQAMRVLVENPRPQGCVKLAGEESLYRIRVGEYRIIYQIQDEVLLVLIISIGHRREVYR